MAFAPGAGWAQLAQRNTDAMRSLDETPGSELFGGLNPSRNEEGATIAPESPGDADLGEQVVFEDAARYDPLEISLRGLGLFTSNAGLTDGDELDDFYTYSELSIRYIPQITDTVFGNFASSYGRYLYGDNSSLDFDTLETSAGLMAVLPELHKLVVWTNYNYTRLSDGDDGQDELLHDHSVEVGLYYPVPIGEKHFVFGSYLSAFSLAGNPENLRRHEHGFTLGYAFSPVEGVEISAYYQVFLYDFLEDGRQDLLHDLGLGLQRHVTRNIDVGLQVSYTLNDSNTSGGDYAVGELGGLLNVSIRF